MLICPGSFSMAGKGALVQSLRSVCSRLRTAVEGRISDQMKDNSEQVRDALTKKPAARQTQVPAHKGARTWSQQSWASACSMRQQSKTSRCEPEGIQTQGTN
jgi:hypothetical protein